MKGLLLVSALVALPGALGAQTNDAVYGSFRWTEDVGAPRAAGLAGAFVAVADDSSATFLNPAGLGLLPKIELAGGLLNRGSGLLAGRSVGPARTGVGFVGGAGLVTQRWAIGGYLTEPHDSRIDLGGSGPDSGYLHSAVTNVGAAVAWKPATRVHLGLRIDVAHLSLGSKLDHRDSAGNLDLEVGSAGGSNRLTLGVGLLVEASDTVRIGATYRPGTTWPVDRVANNPELGISLDSSPYEFHAPAVVSAGLAVHPVPRLLVSGQLDFVRYGEIQSHLAIVSGSFSRDDYHLGNAVEPRLGAELSWPVGSVAVQFRAGVHRQASGSLAYQGANAAEASVFAGTGARTLGAVGASVVSRPGPRLDLAATFGGGRTLVTGGVAVRF